MSQNNYFDFANILSKNMENMSKMAHEYSNSFLSLYDLPNSPYIKEMQDLMQEFYGAIWSNPSEIVSAQIRLYKDCFELFANDKSNISDIISDKRFSDASWNSNDSFEHIKNIYLLISKSILDMIENLSLDDKQKHALRFYTQQMLDAISPANFAFSNPQVIQKALSTNGMSILEGWNNMLNDITKGNITTTDLTAFELGKNIASTPGKVIYRNDLMELIHYTPTKSEVAAIPILVIPPWINKYYILDLQPKNSFIQWLLDAGYSVFLVSWVNPDESLRNKSFEDYMLEGPLEAINFITENLEIEEISLIAYCIGGTLTATLLAYMAAKKDNRVSNCTFLTTLTDFEEPGDLGLFTTSTMIDSIEEQMAKTGYFDGSQMATVFSMLRANDMIWSFVLNNYLLGNDPFPFDLLFWNSDPTRLPEKMHSYYLRNFYEQNNLVKKNQLVIDGVKINLNKIKTPICMVSTIEDHITPWKSIFKGAKNFHENSNVKFILSESGHVAGVINPPSKNKYGYWTQDNYSSLNPEEWLDSASKFSGSWWNAWNDWQRTINNSILDAKKHSSKKFKNLCDAPGTYVKKRYEKV